MGGPAPVVGLMEKQMLGSDVGCLIGPRQVEPSGLVEMGVPEPAVGLMEQPMLGSVAAYLCGLGEMFDLKRVDLME
jgi:hypothetical protein